MKKLKRIIASASAAAMAASALLAAVPASAASVEKEIAYTGPSDGALAFENDGSSLRMNIFNEWGIDIKDIENKGDFSEKISVTFTVSGTGKDGTSNVAKYEKGDITRDGVVDLYDAIEIAKYMMNMIDIDEEQMEVGDINNDGVVDLYDAIEVARTLLPKK